MLEIDTKAANSVPATFYAGLRSAVACATAKMAASSVIADVAIRHCCVLANRSSSRPDNVSLSVWLDGFVWLVISQPACCRTLIVDPSTFQTFG
jgi:hypothetical protein